MTGPDPRALLQAMIDAGPEPYYQATHYITDPESLAWARNPTWPAPSAEAVRTALFGGTITVDHARANGWPVGLP